MIKLLIGLPLLLIGCFALYRYLNGYGINYWTDKEIWSNTEPWINGTNIKGLTREGKSYLKRIDLLVISLVIIISAFLIIFGFVT